MYKYNDIYMNATSIYEGKAMRQSIHATTYEHEADILQLPRGAIRIPMGISNVSNPSV